MSLNRSVKWSIDQQHSSINFSVRHLMVAHVRGSFKQFDASIYITNNDFSTAEIDCWIGAGSVDTGNATRDEHLRATDYFDIDKFPQISFVSGTIGKQNDRGMHELWGELTIKGVTRNIKLDVQFGGMITGTAGVQKSGFRVEGKINRTDWGILFNAPLEIGGVMVGEEVHISCKIELVLDNREELKMELYKTNDNNHVM